MNFAQSALYEGGVTRKDLEICLEGIPYFEEMFETARKAALLPDTNLIILSDANTFFIRTILEKHAMTSLFSQIITNPCCWGSRGLEILPYENGSHGCALCPPNLCKGGVLRSLRHESVGTIFYVGDGGGDFCPARLLKSTDTICARVSANVSPFYGLNLTCNTNIERVFITQEDRRKLWGQ